MIQRFALQLSGDSQVIPVPGGNVGFREIILEFSADPSAGTVTVEERRLGSSEWSAVNRGTDVDLTAGQIRLFSDAPIGSLRVTFSGLTGGSGPALWIVSQSSVMLPFGMVTDGGIGPNSRVRVDVAQTGFFAGREFRTFKEWDVAATETYVIKAVVPINIILFELGVNLEQGSVRIETLVGGTEGGTFAEELPIFPTNTMTEKPQPPYENQVLLTAGGTLTGGTLLDPLRAKTDGNTNRSSSVGTDSGAERGVGANTYYFRVTLTNAIGVFKARWEERPNGSQLPV